MSDSQSQSQSQSETDMEAKTRQKNIEKVIISVPDDIAEQLSNPDNDQQPTFQGLETEKPIMKVGSNVLRGRYVQVAGSDLVFDTTRSQKHAGYTGCCSRRLIFVHSQF